MALRPVFPRPRIAFLLTPLASLSIVADEFNDAIQSWDPDAMAEIFEEVQARYVVLTTKHHDGFTLWPSKLKNPHLPPDQARASRDIVGELARAVRARGIDWSFHPVVIDGTQSGPEVTPSGSEYAAYADGHLRELIDRYQPVVIWNDIRYPPGTEILEIIADYYNEHPDGVINDRWGSSVEHLRGLGQWLKTNGEAIFGSRPWLEAEGSLRGEVVEVRFTIKEDTVYAFLCGTPNAREVVLENIHPDPMATVHLLGYSEALAWNHDGNNLSVTLPEDLPSSVAHVLAISPQPARLMKKKDSTIR